MTLQDFREARAGAKRSLILQAARQAFAARGIAAVSTLEVANMAGVSTATLYRYFPTKLDLFSAVLNESVGDMRKILSEGTGDLDALCVAFAALLSTPQARSLVRMAITSGNAELMQRFYEGGKAATRQLFDMAVEREVSAGRIVTDADPGQLMGMIEHSTLLLGLLAGDDCPTVHPPEHIANEALSTWRARFGLR